jgi:hypothetical protein
LATTTISEEVDDFKLELIKDACKHGFVNPELSQIGHDSIVANVILGNRQPTEVNKYSVDAVGYGRQTEDIHLMTLRPMRPVLKIFRNEPLDVLPRKIRRYTFDVTVDKGVIIIGDPTYSEQTRWFVCGDVGNGVPLFAMRKREMINKKEFDILEFWLVNNVVADYSLKEDTKMIPHRELKIIKFLLAMCFFPTMPTDNLPEDFWFAVFQRCSNEQMSILGATSKRMRLIAAKSCNSKGVMSPSATYIKNHCSTFGHALSVGKTIIPITSYRDLLWLTSGSNPLLDTMRNDIPIIVRELQMIAPCYVDVNTWIKRVPNFQNMVVARDNLSITEVTFVVPDNYHEQKGDYLVWYGRRALGYAVRTPRHINPKIRKKVVLAFHAYRTRKIPNIFRQHKITIVRLYRTKECCW